MFFSYWNDFRRNSSLSAAVSGIRDAFKRRISRLASRVESTTDAEAPTFDEIAIKISNV